MALMRHSGNRFRLKDSTFANIAVVRYFQPHLILEVGSGFSSRVLTLAALKNGNTKLVYIETSLDMVPREGFRRLTSLMPKSLQDIEPG